MYLAALAHPAGAAAQSPDPDALYRDREHLASARQAADLWAGRQDFDSLWKFARACYWLGTHAPQAERRAALERGVRAGEQAAKAQPGRPEGHFWEAANMGALAESFGLSQGIKYRGRIKTSLLKVQAIDRGWQQGSADRALGVWYMRVPGLFGGSDSKAKEHLLAALAYNPQSTATLYFLAELALEDGQRDEARRRLQQVLDAPLDPEWAPEDRDFKAKARAKMGELGRRDPLSARAQYL